MKASRKSSIHAIYFWTMAFLFALGSAGDASADLRIQVEDDHLIATGATAGQPVVFYGVAHSRQDYVGMLASDGDLIKADGQGRASWIPNVGAIPRQSLWFAIDNATGAIAVTTGNGFPLRRLEIPSDVVSRKELSDALVMPFYYAEVLVARPGDGAWVVAAGRGGAKDLKVRGQGLTIDLRTFKKLKGNDPGPSKVKKGDVIVGIDPYALAFFIIQVDR